MYIVGTYFGLLFEDYMGSCFYCVQEVWDLNILE